jgi:hypothetical protein
MSVELILLAGWLLPPIWMWIFCDKYELADLSYAWLWFVPIFGLILFLASIVAGAWVSKKTRFYKFFLGPNKYDKKLDQFAKQLQSIQEHCNELGVENCSLKKHIENLQTTYWEETHELAEKLAEIYRKEIRCYANSTIRNGKVMIDTRHKTIDIQQFQDLIAKEIGAKKLAKLLEKMC